VGGPNVWYMGHMEDQILASVDTAIKNLCPGVVQYSHIDFRGIGCNRRLPSQGNIIFGPYPQGSFDGHTSILRMTRAHSPHQIILVGHACHPTSSGNIEKWSPGYPEAMRDYLVANLPDTKAVFVQGCGADAKVVHKNPDTRKLVFTADPARAHATGEKLGQAVLDHLREGAMTPLAGSLACTLATGQISYGERWSEEETKRQAYALPAPFTENIETEITQIVTTALKQIE